MNFSPMNVPLIREEENASRQRALQFRRRRRMSRPRSNQGPSQSTGISPPDKRILLPGGVMLRSSGISIFSPDKKSVQLLHSKPCCIFYCIFFLQCRAIKRERLPLEQKLSSTPQNLLDREMEKTRAIHSNPPFPRQDGWRVKPRFTLKSYQLQLGFSIAHGGWENVA